MLASATDFPNPGSFATVADDAALPLRIISRNADGTLTVSGIRRGKAITRRCAPGELTPCNPLSVVFGAPGYAGSPQGCGPARSRGAAA